MRRLFFFLLLGILAARYWRQNKTTQSRGAEGCRGSPTHKSGYLYRPLPMDRTYGRGGGAHSGAAAIHARAPQDECVKVWLPIGWRMGDGGWGLGGWGGLCMTLCKRSIKATRGRGERRTRRGSREEEEEERAPSE